MLYSSFGRILVLVVLVGLFLFGGTALADQTIAVSLDGGSNLVFTPPNLDTLPIGAKVTVVNQTGKDIYVRWNDGPWQILHNGNSVQFTGTGGFDTLCIYIPADPGKSEEKCITEKGTPIPTLSEWAMIIFSVVLLGLMTYYVIRRRRLANSVAL